MDLLNLKPVEGSVLELLHPSTGEVITCDEKKPFTLTLLSADSDKWQTMQKRYLEKTLSKRKSNKVDLDESGAKAIEMLARATTACYIVENKKPVKCEFDELIRVYTDYKWVREQAEAFINDRANFIKS